MNFVLRLSFILGLIATSISAQATTSNLEEFLLDKRPKPSAGKSAPNGSAEMSRDGCSVDGPTMLKFDEKKPFSLVVSFAGGGTDGIGSLRILQIVQEMLTKLNPKANLLDVLNYDDTIVAGTSTGAIIAALVKNRNRMNPDTNTRYEIAHFMEMYRTISPVVFGPSWRWLKFFREAPIIDEKLVEVGIRHFRGQLIKDTPGLVIMTMRKNQKRGPVMIAQNEECGEDTLTEAVQKSIAIPFFFRPVHDKRTGADYMDGGTALRNDHPTLDAFDYFLTHQQVHGTKPNQAVVLDIGAGTLLTGTKRLLSTNNQGGCDCFCDGSPGNMCNQCLHSGLEEVQSFAQAEKIAAKTYGYDFCIRCPLSNMQCCLDHTVASAERAVHGDPTLPDLVKKIYEYWERMPEWAKGEPPVAAQGKHLTTPESADPWAEVKL